jgi:DNA mismatch repair protein MutS
MTYTTPMMRQYYEQKRKYRDTILFFRVGDFYETFDEDAKIASKELNIVLTSRGEGRRRIPMAGVPAHALESYVKQLIERGKKIAICEQMEDSTSGVMRREVVSVITPGTVIDDTMLDGEKNNYLMSIYAKERIGMAIVDISTGEFAVTEFSANERDSSLMNEIKRVCPAEIIIPDSLNVDGLDTILKDRYVTVCDGNYFEYNRAYSTLVEHLDVLSLDGFGCSGMHEGIGAAGAIISYLRETQKGALSHISSFSTFSIDDYMVIDSTTLRNLEVVRNIRENTKRGSLLGVLDRTITPMGARLIRKWMLRASTSVECIRARQDSVEELYNDILLREELREALRGIYDVERLICRIVYGNANARDLIALKKSLKNVRRLKGQLDRSSEGRASTMLSEIGSGLDEQTDIIDLIERAILDNPPFSTKDGGLIKGGFSEELDELRRMNKEGKRWILDLEAREKRRTGIKSLKIGYNRVFGYYIEVTRSNIEKVPKDYIRKQTLVNAERFITDDLKEYESKILSAEERIKRIEYEIFEEIRKDITSKGDEIGVTAANIAKLDVLLSFASVAVENEYVRPEVDNGVLIMIKDGRHPMVEQTQLFIPNDTILCSEDGIRIMIITGPNMSGKSTYMRQVALIVLMAQIGSFVSASECRIGIVDHIFSRVGAHDDLSMGQSTFMVEMTETANILNNITPRSLIILDEIGRGTSTMDGLSIAWAVTEYIHDKCEAKTMFATHFHQLTELGERLEGAKNYNFAVRERDDDVIFIRKIKKGAGDRSYGIQVAKLAGLPHSVIDNAKYILSNLDRSSEEEKTEILEELKRINVEETSPIRALNMLKELQRKLK